MTIWTFMDFVKANGENAIQEWMHALPPGARAAIDVRLYHMRAMKVWPSKFIKKYKGVKGKVFELRITHKGVQYRPLGCYGPGSRKFTLLAGAIEKGGKIGKGDLGRAQSRYATLMRDQGRVCKHFN